MKKSVVTFVLSGVFPPYKGSLRLLQLFYLLFLAQRGIQLFLPILFQVLCGNNNTFFIS